MIAWQLPDPETRSPPALLSIISTRSGLVVGTQSTKPVFRSAVQYALKQEKVVSALNRIVVAVSVFLVAGNLCAAQTRTDAQIDGLGGPVKSVVSATFQRDVP